MLGVPVSYHVGIVLGLGLLLYQSLGNLFVGVFFEQKWEKHLHLLFEQCQVIQMCRRVEKSPSVLLMSLVHAHSVFVEADKGGVIAGLAPVDARIIQIAHVAAILP